MYTLSMYHDSCHTFAIKSNSFVWGNKTENIRLLMSDVCTVVDVTGAIMQTILFGDIQSD